MFTLQEKEKWEVVAASLLLWCGIELERDQLAFTHVGPH